MAEESIHVSVRMRPLNAGEMAKGESPICSRINEGVLEFADGKRGPQHSGFDEVFSADASNRDVFDSVVAPMVSEGLEGKNVTVFAYGATGSGKTYTMEGMMNLTARQVFQLIKATPDREFLLKLTAVEVYNEQFHDLLSPARRAASEPRLQYANDKFTIQGLIEEPILSMERLRDLLKGVKGRRKERETASNPHSSRSHQVVTIFIESRVIDTDAQRADGLTQSSVLNSTLTFVDLAGSEPSSAASDAPRRPSTANSPAERQRLQETGKINKTLLSLHLVISKLAEVAAHPGTTLHVPYRGSKLTQLLQPSLGGNSKTAIIANICPAPSAAENTRSTLNFINVASKVTMRPAVNVVNSDESRIRLLESEVQRLKRELASKTESTRAAMYPLALDADAAKSASVLSGTGAEGTGAHAGPVPLEPVQETSVEEHAQQRAALAEQQLKNEKLAKQIAGLERLVLNAPSWRRRSVTTSCDNLDGVSSALLSPRGTTPSRLRPGTNAARLNPLIQSLPAFDLERTLAQRPGTAAPLSATPYGRPPPTPRSDVTPPGMLPESTPEHARLPRGDGGLRSSPMISRFLDCYLSPEALASLRSEDKRPLDSDKRHLLQSAGGSVGAGSVAEGAQASGGGSRSGGVRLSLADVMGELASDGSAPNPKQRLAEEALMAEIRTRKYAHHSTDGDELRLVRLEQQLATMQELQAEQRQLIELTRKSADQQLRDDLEALKSEIVRLKDKEQRDVDAQAALDALKDNIEELNTNISMAAPVALTQQEAAAIVKQEELPEWVGPVLTESSSHGRNSNAVAPCEADHGDVATSRERPLPVSSNSDNDGLLSIRSSASGGAAKHPGPVNTAIDTAVDAAADTTDQTPLRDSTNSYAHAHSGLSASPNLASPTHSKGLDSDATTATSRSAVARASQPRSCAQAGIYGRQSQMSNTTQSLPSPLAPQVGALSPEGAHSASENTYQSLPERGASARPPRPSHARGLEGGQPLGETGTPSNRSQASFDSSRTEGDDETKAIILKAINGMRTADSFKFTAMLRAMQAKWKATSERTIAAMQAVLQKYQDENQQLELQKGWLVNKILGLELEDEASKAEAERLTLQVEAGTDRADALEMQAEDMHAQLADMQAQLVDMEAQLAAAGRVEAQPFVRTLPSPELQQQPAEAAGPSAVELLADIVQLWEQLHLPLLHRSKFVIAHAGRAPCFFEAEKAHLEALEQHYSAHPEALQSSRKGLKDERTDLVKRLKDHYIPEELDELFARWGVEQTKQRKKALVWHHLWSQAMTGSAAGVESSAKLVLILHGWDGHDRSMAGVMHGITGAPSAAPNGIIRSAASFLSRGKSRAGARPTMGPSPGGLADGVRSSNESGMLGTELGDDASEQGAPTPTGGRTFMNRLRFNTPTR